MSKPKSINQGESFQTHFAQACAVFQAPLALHGFAAAEPVIERAFGSRCFLAEPRYVRISATVDPHDAPFLASVVLGEGGMGMPECDWNSVALWHLVEHTAPDARAHGVGSYALKAPVDLVPTFERMLADLLQYGSAFLSGDLQEFRHIRAVLARSRKPYTIHTSNGNGRYVARDDPESAALKQRFSRDG